MGSGRHRHRAANSAARGCGSYIHAGLDRRPDLFCLLRRHRAGESLAPSLRRPAQPNLEIAPSVPPLLRIDLEEATVSALAHGYDPINARTIAQAMARADAAPRPNNDAKPRHRTQIVHDNIAAPGDRCHLRPQSGHRFVSALNPARAVTYLGRRLQHQPAPERPDVFQRRAHNGSVR